VDESIGIMIEEKKFIDKTAKMSMFWVGVCMQYRKQ
jgi:hypothetical protein